ncbi:unnamed protein product [Penicillium bialowiezense]
MRLNLLILALGLASAAVPPAKTNNTSPSPFLEENLRLVPQLAAECSLAACLNVTAQLTCIANAVANGDPTALQKCLTTSMTQICSCIACIPALNNVLTALGVCPVTPPPTPPTPPTDDSPGGDDANWRRKTKVEEPWKTNVEVPSQTPRLWETKTKLDQPSQTRKE